MKVSLLTGTLLFLSLALVTSRPTSAGDTVESAFTARLSGQAEEAREQLRKLVADDPSLAQGWFELARTEFYLMEFDDAQQSIDKAMALAPDSARYHYLAGTLAAYRAVRQAHEPNSEAEVGRAMQRWVQELEKTVELAPQHYRACVDLVNAYHQTPAEFGGDPAKAEPIIARLESASPVDAVEARATTIGAEKRAELLALWQRTVDTQADSAAAHAGLARAAMRAGDLDKAAQQIAQAVKLDPQHVQLQLDLARTAGMGGKYEQATAAVQEYLKAEPAPAAAMRAYATFLLGAIEGRQRHKERADELLQEARRIDQHVWTTFMPPPALLFEKL